MNAIAFFVLLLQLASGQSSTSPLERIRAKITVDPETSLSPLRIAGRYSNPSKELVKLVGPPLRGNNLYIFPDNTYVYCEWADIMPTTVFDRGTWSFSETVLRLKSAPEITWDPHLERRFLAAHRPTRIEEILLVGIDEDLPYFEEKAGNDPELMLLIIAGQREQAIGQAESAKLKASLMRDGWKPDFLRK
jgi:hypothetical protein